MRTLTAIVALMLVVPAFPRTTTTTEAAEPACRTEAAAYLAASDPSSARSDLLFCLLGDAAITSDTVAFGEEGATYYKAFPSTKRVLNAKPGGGGGGGGMALFTNCPTTKPAVKLIDDGGSMKWQKGVLTVDIAAMAETMLENGSARDFFATQWQAPLTVDLDFAKPGRTDLVLDYIWDRASGANAGQTTGTGCPTWKPGLIGTGGKLWNIANPIWAAQIEMMELPANSVEFDW